MELYIYSDESGVLDKIHNNYYTYGGLIFTSKEDRDVYSRKYLSAERKIANTYEKGIELKACRIKNKDKSKLYKVVRPCVKFGSIIDQKKLLDQLFDNKKVSKDIWTMHTKSHSSMHFRVCPLSEY